MGINIKAVLKGALFSLAVTLVFIIIIAAIAYFTKISEGTVTVLAYIALAVGTLAGSFAVTRAAESRRLVHVLLMSAVYAAVLLVASALINGRIGFNAHTAAVMAGIFLTSLLGAVLGNR